MEAAVKKIEEFMIEFTDKLCNTTQDIAEIVFFGDDFSTQRNLLLSPEHFRAFLLPTYKKLFEMAKSYGMKVWFHSFGTFRPVFLAVAFADNLLHN